MKSSLLDPKILQNAIGGSLSNNNHLAGDKKAGQPEINACRLPPQHFTLFGEGKYAIKTPRLSIVQRKEL